MVAGKNRRNWENIGQAPNYDWIIWTTVAAAAAGTALWLYNRYKQNNTMILSTRTIDFIIQEEVTSKDKYTRSYSRPIWPGAQSGITIGIGYDLGYNSVAQIAADWADLPKQFITLLQSAAGKKGTAAQAFLNNNPSLKSVVVPFETAAKVFISKSLPKYAKAALKIYPGLNQLLPDAAGAIVSMVYNRGTDLEGDRRREMKAIVPMVAKKDYAGIAQQIDASKRLWVGSTTPGLVTRREREAALVRNAIRQYVANETVALNLA